MKHLPLVLLFTGTVLFAADRGDIDRLVDFSVTIESLEGILSGEIPFEEGKLVILEGSIGSITVMDKNPDTFLAIGELVKGTWEGLENIRIYKCLLQFYGKEFSGRVSGRPSDDSSLISLNGRVLVIGKLGAMELEDGSVMPFLDVYFARTL